MPDPPQLDAEIAKQMRFWSRIAGAVVVFGTFAVAAWEGEPYRWAALALDMAWAVFLVLGSRRPIWLLGASSVAVVQLALHGWTAPGSFILLVAAFAMRFPFRRALLATLVLWLGVAIGLWLLGDDQPPDHAMRPFELVLAMGNTFLLGWLMRGTVTSRLRVQSLADQLRAANDMLQGDLQTTEALSAAQERTRIARELHDNLGHSLAAAHVHTQLARKLLVDADPALVKAVDQVVASTRQAMHELRDAVALLRERTHDELLGQRVATLLRRLPDAVLHHELEIVGSERRLSPAKEFAVYRALQEAITNVAKHAHAHCVRVRLEFTPSRVRLDVTDDGVGTANVQHGFGLRGIAERLEAVGGRLELSSAPGRGFHLCVEVDAS
jgi:signal transduction histidine kinase